MGSSLRECLGPVASFKVNNQLLPWTDGFQYLEKIVCRIQKQGMGLASLMSRDVCFWTIPHFFPTGVFVHNNIMNSGSLSNFLNSIQAQTEANYSLNYRHSEHEALKPNFSLLCQSVYDLSHEFDYPYLNIQNSKCYYYLPQNYSSWWKLLHF